MRGPYASPTGASALGAVFVVTMLGGLVAGCAPPTDRSATPAGGPTAASVGERPPLPPGFPVLPGALAAPLPQDDPGLVAAWTTDLHGAAAYDFYVSALPTAGYPIVGLYPGGEWVIIRFRLADGAAWQLLVHGTLADTVEVEVRLDRP